MTERGYQLDIKRKCEALGVWRTEFERTQKRLAKIYTRIDRVEALFLCEWVEFSLIRVETLLCCLVVTAAVEDEDMYSRIVDYCLHNRYFFV